MKFLLTLFYITFFFLNAFSQNPLTDSLIAYYPFSGNAFDASGNGNNGAVYGATLTADRFGNPYSAYLFDGVSNYISYKASLKYHPQFPISITAWIKADATDISPIFGNDDTPFIYSGMYLTINPSAGGVIGIGYGDNGPKNSANRRGKSGSINVNDNRWHFIAGICRDSADMDIYIDCKYDVGGTYSGGGGPMVYTDTVGVSGRGISVGSTQYFQGAIDEIRYYHKSLSESDLQVIRDYPNTYINPNDSLSASISSANSSICMGQELTFSAMAINGGNSPVYQWKVNGNNAGTDSSVFSTASLGNGDIISCVVTSSQMCVVNSTDTSNSIPITVTSIDAGIISSQVDTVCSGSGTELTLKNNTAGIIQWQSSGDSISGFTDIIGSTSASYSNVPVSATTYYRVVINSGPCTAISPAYKITVLPAPSASFTASVSSDTAAFTSSVSSGVVSYYWDFGNGHSSSIENPYYNFDSVGTFDVCLTVKNNSNCNYTVCQNVTTYPTGIDEVGNLGSLNVYPDPFSSQLFINPTGVDLVAGTIEIYDVLGRDVFSSGAINMMQNPVVLDVSKLQAGMYFVWVKTKGGDYVKPLVKQ